MKSSFEKVDLIDFDKLEDTSVPSVLNYYPTNCIFNVSSNAFRSLATSITNIINKINWS